MQCTNVRRKALYIFSNLIGYETILCANQPRVPLLTVFFSLLQTYVRLLELYVSTYVSIVIFASFSSPWVNGVM